MAWNPFRREKKTNAEPPAPPSPTKTAPSLEQRGFNAVGRNDVLLSRWTGSFNSINSQLRVDLPKLRRLSRDLFLNNPLARKFKFLAQQNVVGPNGILLQVRSKEADGSLDERANDLIEAAWAKWGIKGNPTVDGRHSWLSLQHAVLGAWAEDGEVFLRKVLTRDGLKLQIIGSEYVDEQYSDVLSPDRRVVLGVELDRFDRPIAYYVRAISNDPQDTSFSPASRTKHVRVPAEEMVHVFFPDQPKQLRGFPPLAPVMRDLQLLSKYQEMELAAAVAGASQMGFITTPAPEFQADTETEDGQPVFDAGQLNFHTLNPGESLETFSPQHPTSAFADFVKATIRFISSGLGVSYNSLANDLESVNYSSLRAGSLEERDRWMTMQQNLIDCFCTPFFSEWLKDEILVKNIRLPAEKLDKFNAPEWKPRRWDWVDPLKDANAKQIEFEMGLTTLTEIAAEQGKDLFSLIQEKKQEMEWFKEAGIKYPEPKSKSGAPQAPSQGEPFDEQEPKAPRTSKE